LLPGLRSHGSRVSRDDHLDTMSPSFHLLAEALGLAALIGATIEYMEILRRREQSRVDRAAAITGLRGLVRLFAADDVRRAARMAPHRTSDRPR
jgi:hypothetical protein